MHNRKYQVRNNNRNTQIKQFSRILVPGKAKHEFRGASGSGRGSEVDAGRQEASGGVRRAAGVFGWIVDDREALGGAAGQWRPCCLPLKHVLLQCWYEATSDDLSEGKKSDKWDRETECWQRGTRESDVKMCKNRKNRSLECDTEQTRENWVKRRKVTSQTERGNVDTESMKKRKTVKIVTLETFME